MGEYPRAFREFIGVAGGQGPSGASPPPATHCPCCFGTTWGRLLVNREPIAAPQGCAEPYGPDGLWVSEVICPTNERPGDGYVDVSALYTLALR